VRVRTAISALVIAAVSCSSPERWPAPPSPGRDVTADFESVAIVDGAGAEHACRLLHAAGVSHSIDGGLDVYDIWASAKSRAFVHALLRGAPGVRLSRPLVSRSPPDGLTFVIASVPGDPAVFDALEEALGRNGIRFWGDGSVWHGVEVEAAEVARAMRLMRAHPLLQDHVADDAYPSRSDSDE
jgi:hypothetical protein